MAARTQRGTSPDNAGSYRRRLSGSVRQFTHPSWGTYETRKADWTRANPEATPAEYQAAMTRIARECGV